MTASRTEADGVGGQATTWHNWGGNQVAHPTAVEHPRDVDEVSALVKRVAADGRLVKVVGAGHSFTAAAATDGVLVHLDRMAEVVTSDLGSGLVTVQGGIPLHKLNTTLHELGLAMTNLGDIERQSIAGATSTGTHGTGRLLGGLATQIRALELVIGDGSVITCSPTEQPEVFESARIGLGALGVVTSVTLQCEPAFVLEANEQPLPLDAVMADIDSHVDDNEHFEFYWFPHTDVALTKSNNRVAPGVAPQPLKRWREWLDDELLANTVYNAVCALGKRRPALVPRLNTTAAGMLSARRFSDDSYKVFTSPRRVRFVEMEYAVPRAAVHDALAAIRHVIDRDGLRISFPVEVRFVAPDDIPLSTSYGRETAYLAIHRYRGEPFEGYFRAVENEMKALGGRPHWGKMHWRTADDLRPAYPKFDDFLAVRDRLDPERVFANTYTETVLGR
ncbi:MAG: FAD-binding protein [Frankiales bacterium]|nr:FAD-binding protein [Frankiales bacterium]